MPSDLGTDTDGGAGLRLLITLPNAPAIRAACRAAARAPGETPRELIRALGLDPAGAGFAGHFVRLPSLGAPGAANGAVEAALARLPALIAVARVPPGEVEGFRRWLEPGSAGAAPRGRARVQPDLPIGPLWEHWAPRSRVPPIFHTRAAAMGLLRADALRGLDGEGVNVVVFDSGLDAAALAAFRPGATVAGHWRLARGSSLALPEFRTGPAPAPPGTGHGDMVARNILALAPRARLFDLPLLPPSRIADVLAYTSDAAVALLSVAAQIALAPALQAFRGPWVFCNAWGVFDTRLEVPSATWPVRYSDNPLHLLNLVFRAIDRLLGHDVVFGAGNAGQFAPDRRAGPNDIGPGRSVLGAASSHAVLTAGAVRADGMCLGYSSQGPGQPAFRRSGEAFCEKPDLCCPSAFRETDDAHAVSGGTSAACGLAAGAIAALRTRRAAAPVLALGALPPARLRGHLRRTARKPPSWAAAGGYDIRYGHGILDLHAALAEAPSTA